MSLQRVLVCDDSLTIRRLVSMVATNLGIQLEMAVNVAEGVGKAKSSRPELILLDYVLPDGRGEDVLAELGRNESTAGIPVVMMSAKGEALAERLANHTSVVGYLGKPFKPQDLEQLLRHHGGRNEPAAHAPQAAAHPEAPSVAASVTGEGVLARIEDPALAKLLFKVLRAELTKLGEWLLPQGVKTDAGDLAKRLIRPTVVRDLRAEIEQACPNRRRGALGWLQIGRSSVPERVPGFSSKIVGLPLREPERSLLGLVDGVRSLGEIERELQWPAADMATVVDTVAGLGLVRLRTGLSGGSRPGTLWMIDELPGEFVSDLAAHLARHGRRWTLVRLRVGDVADALQRSVPDGVLVHCASPDVVATLRAMPALERLPMAAIHDDTALASGALLGAGADLALALPVRTSAIDSFLCVAGAS